MTAAVLLATGALVALCFDLFRSLRKAYKKQPGWLIHIEDIVFLVVAAVLLVVSFCVTDYGQVRWYTFVLSIFGVLAYFFGISPWFGKIITFFLSIPGKIAHFFSKFILKK